MTLILDAATWAYAAGVVDGEGCISVRERRRPGRGSGVSFEVRIEVANNNRSLLEWFRLRWGGTIIRATVTAAGRDHYSWRCCAEARKEFLSGIAPFLVIKGAEARNALRMVASLEASRTTRLNPLRDTILVDRHEMAMSHLTLKAARQQ